jgi:outer membrane protein TolC
MRTIPSLSFLRLRAPALLAALLLPGCLSMELDPMTPEEVARRNTESLRLVALQDEPLPANLTLEWAFARALKFNLDRRVKKMEAAIALGQFDLAKFDTLPKLTAEAGYNYRNNESIVNVRDSVTGRASLANPSISNDRIHVSSAVGPSWNLLDFGTSYFAAKQAGDRALAAGERRRKATHLLLAEVRSAFWRVAVGQRIAPELKQALADAEAALVEARRMEQDRLRPPAESLRLQRALLEHISQLEALQQDMSVARIELASLIGAPVATGYAVTEPAFALPKTLLEVSADEMEQIALANNPDLAMALYDVRIAQQEAHKAITKLFPSVTFEYQMRYDTDSYMINDSWQTASARISFDLFRFATLGRDLEAIALTEDLARRKQMATLMATVAQVNLSRIEYGMAYRAFERSEQTAAVDGRLREVFLAQAREELQSRLEVVAARTNALLSLGQRYRAMIQVQAAIGRMQSTLGLDPLLEPPMTIPTQELATRLATYTQGWQDGSWIKTLPKPAR